MSKRKIMSLLLAAAFIIIVTGCEKDGSTADGSPVETVSAENVPEQEASIPQEISEEKDGVDVDLTLLSSTMVYSEVYDMMYYPEKYVGKTVKMNGMYSVFHDEIADKYYHGCIIMDATACCAQGIEFELTDDYVYPDDYPKEGETICVAGTFDTYSEGESTYCTLKNARIDQIQDN